MSQKHYLFLYGPLRAGGAERVLIDLLRNFDYSRFAVDLCLLCPGGELFDEIPAEVNVITLYPAYTRSYSIAYHLSRDLGCEYLLRRKLRQKLEDKYDVVISFLEGIPLHLQTVADLGGRQYTWVHCDLYHFPYEASQFHKGAEEADYNKMDGVICVSTDTEAMFRKRFPACTAASHVIYNPVDLDKVRRMAKEGTTPRKEGFTVVVVGRLTPQKKTQRVLRLAARLKREGIDDIRFRFVGDGELRTEMEQTIRELGISDRVELTGFTKNPYRHIAAADLLLSSSVAEGFSLVVVEAMAIGTPVVATRTAGPSEILRDTYGLLCDHDDEAIYNAVMRMYNDPELRKKYVEAGYKRAEDFSVAKAVNAVGEL